MIKKILSISLFTLALYSVNGQAKYYSTKSGQAYFDAGTGIEDIKGINKSTTSVIEPSTGKIQFSLQIKGFEFKSQLMQDHFNENYMESDKYPNSTFKGNITNIENVSFTKDGTYPVTVKGILEMHGVKKDIETKGTLKVSGENVIANADFNVQMADYKIDVPSVVGDKLSKTAKIKINCTYKPLK
jgi:polyisoprenoid-binding protein YceI